MNSFSNSFSTAYDVTITGTVAATLVPSRIVPAETALTDPSNLWALSRMFMMSWAQAFSVSTTWFTNTITTNNGGQKRISVSGKPSRIVRFSLLTMQRRECWLLMNMIKRMGQGRSLIPLYGDFTRTTVPITTTTITCDTTYRRFFIGGLITIAIPTSTGEILAFEIATINTITTTTLIVTTPLTRSYPPGTRIIPLIEADVMLEADIAVVTDQMMQANLICKESEGTGSLPPILEISATSPYPVQNGYPVFHTQLQWSESMKEGFHGSARTTKSGIGTLFELIGSRPRWKSDRNTYTFDRASGWKILSFFDYVCGSAWPFFILSMVSPYNVVSISTTTIVVQAAGPLLDWQDLAYIAVIRRSTNLPSVVPITSVTRSGTDDTINLGAALPVFGADVRAVHPAYLVRFSSDEITETWVTDSQLSLQFGVVELLNEATVTLNLTGFSFTYDTTQLRDLEGGGQDIYTGPIEVIPTAGYTSITFNGAVDDLGVIIPTTAAVTVNRSTSTYVLTSTLPTNYILLLPTFGSTDIALPWTSWTITDGTNSMSLPGVNQTPASVASYAAGSGLRTLAMGTAISTSTLSSLGYIDSSGNFYFRFVLMPSGSGRINITSVTLT